MSAMLLLLYIFTDCLLDKLRDNYNCRPAILKVASYSNFIKGLVTRNWVAAHA